MSEQQPDAVWRVALVVSSADPRKHIPWLATGEDDMKRVAAHRDFIRWLSPRSDELSRLQAGGQGVEPVAWSRPSVFEDGLPVITVHADEAREWLDNGRVVTALGPIAAAPAAPVQAGQWVGEDAK